MATLMIIGGTGFFGKSILDSFRRSLLANWHIDRVIVASRSGDHFKKRYPHLLGEKVEVIDLDIATTNAMPFADYIIHAASSTDARNYLLNPESEKNNILSASINFCRIIKENPVYKKTKIIYCSSGAVYGQQSSNVPFLKECDAFVGLKTLSEAKRGYAAAKRDSEELIISLGKQGYSVSIARCFAFIGSYLPRDQHFAIGNFLNDGLKNQPPTLINHKSVVRSYMYVDDLVEWLMTIAYSGSPSCPIYNVGSDQAITLLELAKYISQYFNLDFVEPRIDITEVDRYVPSIEKAQHQLGLGLRYDLFNAIDSSVKGIKSLPSFFL